MAKELNYDALGDAVSERRKELALSIRDATELSRRIDIEVNGQPGRKPGLGDTTWTKVGQGVKTKRYPHTLHLIDQTLRWPEGTAHALLHGEKLSEKLPDTPVADGPCECARRKRLNSHGTVSDLLEPATVSDVEASSRQGEVDLLRREVLRLIDRVEGFEEKLEQALRSIK